VDYAHTTLGNRGYLKQSASSYYTKILPSEASETIAWDKHAQSNTDKSPYIDSPFQFGHPFEDDKLCSFQGYSRIFEKFLPKLAHEYRLCQI
jgi:hypothetical protein